MYLYLSYFVMEVTENNLVWFVKIFEKKYLLPTSGTPRSHLTVTKLAGCF